MFRWLLQGKISCAAYFNPIPGCMAVLASGFPILYAVAVMQGYPRSPDVTALLGWPIFIAWMVVLKFYTLPWYHKAAWEIPISSARRDDIVTSEGIASYLNSGGPL